MAGVRAAAWAVAGGTVGRIATRIVLAKTPRVTWLQFGKYAVALTGMPILTYGLVLAYRTASVGAPRARACPPRPSVGSLEPVGGD